MAQQAHRSLSIYYSAFLAKIKLVKGKHQVSWIAHQQALSLLELLLPSLRRSTRAPGQSTTYPPGAGILAGIFDGLLFGELYEYRLKIDHCLRSRLVSDRDYT